MKVNPTSLDDAPRNKSLYSPSACFHSFIFSTFKGENHSNFERKKKAFGKCLNKLSEVVDSQLDWKKPEVISRWKKTVFSKGFYRGKKKNLSKWPSLPSNGFCKFEEVVKFLWDMKIFF